MTDDLLLALDPGERTGWALFRGPRLIGAGTWKGDPEGQLWDALVLMAPAFITVVIEEPGTRGWNDKASKASLAVLNQRVGGFAATVRFYGVGMQSIGKAITTRVAIIPVAKWKGNKPKVQTQRDMVMIYRKDLERLRPESLDHNTFDAIGLGHWFLGYELCHGKKGGGPWDGR